MGEINFKKALMDFIGRLTYASHIIPLLENEKISVKFSSTDQNEASITLNGKEAQLAVEHAEEYSLIIRGDSMALLELIEGRVKLQELKRRGEISVEGRFRYLLKIESLLYCCASETMTIKV